MAHLKINGLVQIRSTNRSKHTRASQWKEAVIEIVEKKQKVNLVVSFKLEERRRVFQLGDNVTGVVVSGELGLYHLDLTLRDDTSLLIDKLSSEDVDHLKSFLDSSTPCESQQPMEPKSDQDALESSDPFCEEHQEAACGSPSTSPESGTLLSQKMPLATSNTTGSQAEKKKGEKQGRKRKTEPSSSSVEINKDILKENTPDQKRKSRRYYSRNRGGKAERAVALREQEKRNNWKLEPAFNSKAYGKCTLDGTILPIATCSDDRDVSIFGLEIITHNGVQALPDPFLNQLKREGFPNLGNTCYMNSILQSVFGIPTFAKDLLTQGIPWEKVSYDDLIMPLSQLLVLKDIRDIEIKGELLTSVKKSISTVADTFSGNEQNDAHEFLSLCLDQLKLNMEKVNAMWDTERKDEPTCAGAAATKRFVCPVGANFEFELHSSIVCEGCGEATIKTEVSNYLSIDLHHGTKAHPLSIQKSFDLFFTPEKIEHNCDKCKNKNSVLKYTLRRLPRVLIVHLKRYQVTTDLLPVKSEQPVEISKYLNISNHCDENRKPPVPLANTPSKGDYDVPNVSRMMPEIFTQSMSSKKVTSESCDPMVLQIGSSVDAEIQSFQIMYEDEDAGEEQQQSGLGSGSMLDPELVKTENRMLRQKTLPATDSMIADGYSFLPMLCEPLSIQDPDLTEMGLQEVPENPEFKNYEKINIYGKSDGRTGIELSKLYQSHGSRIKASFLPASFASVSSQEDPEKELQEDDPHSFVLGSDESRDVELGDDLQNYRLVSVVSHFGSSPNSGHYVSDVYDFQRQAWLLYSDVQVFESSDPSIQENRLNSGYIFFYMHNEIFEELLKKASECKVLSTLKEEKRDIDYFSTLLNGLTYILEEF